MLTQTRITVAGNAFIDKTERQFQFLLHTSGYALNLPKIDAGGVGKRHKKRKQNEFNDFIFVFFYFYFLCSLSPTLILQLLCPPRGGTCVTTDENKLTSCPRCEWDSFFAASSPHSLRLALASKFTGQTSIKENFVAGRRKKEKNGNLIAPLQSRKVLRLPTLIN